MSIDHAKLLRLLHLVQQIHGGDVIETIKVFDTFEWELEKHFFAEEKAIFTSYDPDNIIEGYKMVPTLIKDHTEILNTIRTLRRDILKRRPLDFNHLTESLIEHKKFEEEEVYPKLDQELTEEQKSKIIDRITQIA